MCFIKSEHKCRNKNKLENYSGKSVDKCPCHKHCKSKSSFVETYQKSHCDSPDDPSADHCGDHAAVKRFYAVPTGVFIHETNNESVSGKFKSHGCRIRIHGRHNKNCGAHKRHYKADCGAVFSSADKSAEKNRNMHRKKHATNLRDLAGQERKNHSEGEKHCAEHDFFDIVLSFRKNHPSQSDYITVLKILKQFLSKKKEFCRGGHHHKENYAYQSEQGKIFSFNGCDKRSCSADIAPDKKRTKSALQKNQLRLNAPENLFHNKDIYE